MKFFGTVLTLGLALGTLAEPIPKHSKRDAQVFLDAFTSVNEQVTVLETAMTDFAGDATDVSAASAELIKRIEAGTTAVSAEPELTSTEALGLVGPIQDLTTDINASIDATIEQEPAFIEAGIEADILESLNAQKAGSGAFSEAVVDKVPEALKDTAAQLAAGIADAIQRGIDAYSD